MPYGKTEMVNGQNMGSRAVAIQAQKGDVQIIAAKISDLVQSASSEYASAKAVFPRTLTIKKTGVLVLVGHKAACNLFFQQDIQMLSNDFSLTFNASCCYYKWSYVWGYLCACSFRFDANLWRFTHY